LTWLAVVAVVAALPVDSAGRSVTAVLAFSVAAVFAAGASGYAASAVIAKEKLFWWLLGSGLLLRFAGYLGWLGLQESPMLARTLNGVSYVLIFAALLYLATLVRKRLSWVSALDAATIVFSSGALLWTLVIRPYFPDAGVYESLIAVSRPALDAGLLYIGLVILSAKHKPQWASFLAPGFLVLLLSCTVHLGSVGSALEAGGWFEMLGALGMGLLGCGAVYAASGSAGFETHQKIAPWREFSFWFGPLSPAVHFGVILVWGAYNQPLPAYALAVGAGLMLYFAFRISLMSYINRQSGLEEVRATRQNERNILLEELHETVKQSVHGVSLTLDSASEAARLGEDAVVHDRIGRARDAIREAEYRISHPYDELRSRQSEDEAHPASSFLCYRLARFEEYFGIKAHRDLQSPLDGLEEDQIEAVNRIAVEAFWNVAKHSRASNLYLESRRVGRVLIVRIRDDGRGFDVTNARSGMGLVLMRRRSREAGAELDVISKPGVGTTVQMRFRVKELRKSRSVIGVADTTA
jgi:signal transduction histidine kinase